MNDDVGREGGNETFGWGRRAKAVGEHESEGNWIREEGGRRGRLRMEEGRRGGEG